MSDPTKPVFYDPSIDRKKRLVDAALTANTASVPLPSILEVSESGTCNRVCAFCPRSAPDYDDRKEFITLELLDKLTRQAADVGFEGVFIFSGFSEPMIDKGIYERIALVRKNLPGTRIDMVTNGDPLTPKNLPKVFDAGLNTLLISVYDGPEDAERLRKLCTTAGFVEGQDFVIRDRWLPPEQDFGITISNRGGMLENAKHARPALNEPLKTVCNYPAYQFFMDYNGDVLLCAHDWGKKMIIGNLNNKDFMELWTARSIMLARKRLLNADRAFGPCKVCDVHGNLIGKESAAVWRDYFTADEQEKKHREK